MKKKTKTVGKKTAARKKPPASKKNPQLQSELIDVIPQPVFIIHTEKGPDSKFVYVNDAACKSLGYTKEELLKLGINDISASSPAQKPELIKKVFSLGNVSIKAVHKKKDKTRLPVDLNLSCVSYMGKPAVMGVSYDRSEYVKAEQAADEVLRMSMMRAEMWKLSACGSGSESQLVEKIFAIIGPGLDASRLVFSAVRGDYFVAISEWLAPGVKGSMKGIKVPKKIFDAMAFTGQIIIGKKELSELFPKILRPVIEKLIDLLIKIGGEKPALVTPYNIDGSIQGEITATGLSEPVTAWSEAKKGLLREAVAVIATSIELGKAKEKQKDTEQKFRAIMNNITGVFVRHYINEDRVEMNYNDTYRRLLGLPEGYFTSNAIIKYRELIHPDDLKKASEISDYGARNLPSYYQEYRLKSASGEYIWVAENVTVIRDENGIPIWTDNFIFDINEKKQGEIKLRETQEQFTAAFMASPDYMSITRMSDSVITEANDAFAYRFGYTRQEIIGKTTIELSMWADPSDRERWIKTVSADSRASGFEVRLKDRYGDIFHAMLSAGVMEISGEKYLLTVARDISSLKQAQKAMAESLEEARRSNEELERFAYIASHDLQEPLRMVSNYLQLIEKRYKETLDAEGHEFIGYAVDGARRMQQLIKDLLTFSRSGSRQLEVKKVNLGNVLAQAMRNLEEAIKEKGAAINSFNLPEIEADEMQMVQLFQNLLGNGIKFARQGVKPVIDIKAEKQGGNYMISFSDNGIGIDVKHQDKIFVIFNRLHSRDDYPGNGIGLAVCKKIAERHKGSIRVESEPGKGSVFTVTVPEKLAEH